MVTQLSLFGDPVVIAEPKAKPPPVLPGIDKPNGVAINLRGALPERKRWERDGVQYELSAPETELRMSRGEEEWADIRWMMYPAPAHWNWYAGGETYDGASKDGWNTETRQEAIEGVLARWEMLRRKAETA